MLSDNFSEVCKAAKTVAFEAVKKTQGTVILPIYPSCWFDDAWCIFIFVAIGVNKIFSKRSFLQKNINLILI